MISSKNTKVYLNNKLVENVTKITLTTGVSNHPQLEGKWAAELEFLSDQTVDYMTLAGSKSMKAYRKERGSYFVQTAKVSVGGLTPYLSVSEHGDDEDEEDS